MLYLVVLISVLFLVVVGVIVSAQTFKTWDNRLYFSFIAGQSGTTCQFFGFSEVEIIACDDKDHEFYCRTEQTGLKIQMRWNNVTRRDCTHYTELSSISPQMKKDTECEHDHDDQVELYSQLVDTGGNSFNSSLLVSIHQIRIGKTTDIAEEGSAEALVAACIEMDRHIDISGELSSRTFIFEGMSELLLHFPSAQHYHTLQSKARVQKFNYLKDIHVAKISFYFAIGV